LLPLPSFQLSDLAVLIEIDAVLVPKAEIILVLFSVIPEFAVRVLVKFHETSGVTFGLIKVEIELTSSLYSLAPVTASQLALKPIVIGLVAAIAIGADSVTVPLTSTFCELAPFEEHTTLPDVVPAEAVAAILISIVLESTAPDIGVNKTEELKEPVPFSLISKLSGAVSTRLSVRLDPPMLNVCEVDVVPLIVRKLIKEFGEGVVIVGGRV
jgi:hypothetical protein